jgi:hypothetical protein
MVIIQIEDSSKSEITPPPPTKKYTCIQKVIFFSAFTIPIFTLIVISLLEELLLLILSLRGTSDVDTEDTGF